MRAQIVGTLLILFAFATASVNPASAQGKGFRNGGFHGGGGGGFHGHRHQGRGFHRHGIYGGVGLYGLVEGYGYGSGYADWYGITPGYDECPRFRQRVMTREGWRVQMIPVC
jgi:hypothetical protein